MGVSIDELTPEMRARLLVIKGRRLLPIVQGGMGVGVSTACTAPR